MQASLVSLRSIKSRYPKKAADVASAKAFLYPPHPFTASSFCEIASSAMHSSPDGSAIMDVGAIPVLFEQLQLWPTNKKVVLQACIAIHHVANKASASVLSALRRVPDCERLLRAAAATQFDFCFASAALQKLGLLRSDDPVREFTY